jgi:hypothetical protein
LKSSVPMALQLAVEESVSRLLQQPKKVLGRRHLLALAEKAPSASDLTIITTELWKPALPSPLRNNFHLR